MSRYRRDKTPGATYFFTLTTFRRRPILCDEPLQAALWHALSKVRSRRPFAIDAWVLMPDHLHCLWTLPPGDADFASRWSLVKREVSLTCGDEYRREEWLTPSKRKHRESTIWQRRYWEHRIRSDDDYARHVDYIHFNPVKHGLSRSPGEWPYSTFHRFVNEDIYPENWAGGMIDEDAERFGE
jgi:putative transposase